MSVTVRQYVVDKYGRGTWQESIIERVTGGDGTIDVSTGSIKLTGTNRTTSVQFSVNDVDTHDDQHPWDGDGATVTLDAP